MSILGLFWPISMLSFQKPFAVDFQYKTVSIHFDVPVLVYFSINKQTR